MGCACSKNKSNGHNKAKETLRSQGKVDPLYDVKVSTTDDIEDGEEPFTAATYSPRERLVSFDPMSMKKINLGLRDGKERRERPRAHTFLRQTRSPNRRKSLRQSFEPSDFPSPLKSPHRGKNAALSKENSKLKLMTELPISKSFLLRLHTIRAVESDYVLGDEIYRSNHCRIYKTTHRKTNRERIVKRYEFTTEARDFIFEKVNREYEVLSSLDHPGIMKLYEMYETTYYYYMALDSCSDVSLHSRLKHMSITKTNEATLGFVIFQLLHILSYIHRRKIVHRRINPSHILFTGNEFTSGIKLTGFSLVQLPDQDAYTTLSPGNTQEYRAPEELLGSTTAKSDVWAVGILLYRLLTGKSPYSSQEPDKLVREILDFEFDLRDPNLRGVSTDGKELLSRLLCKNVDKRMPSTLALTHPWVLNSVRLYKLLLKPNFNQLGQIGPLHFSRLRQLMSLFVILTILPGEEFRDLEKVFYFISHQGVLFADNFLEEENPLMKSFQANGGTSTIYWEVLGRPATSYISFKEFILVEWFSKHEVSQDNLMLAFFNLDWNGDNYISPKDLQRVMDPHSNYPLPCFEALLSSYDGQMSLDEFSDLVNGTALH